MCKAANKIATQNGAAVGVGNTVVNQADQTAIQDITKIKNGISCHGSYNAQVSGQNLQQNGAAVGTANTVANVGSQAALQTATKITNGFHNCY
ncbi:hypothetical protein FJSC11DRAFT_4624 [Fischerella thermalis JSC-11]|uniref:Filamentous hemagglutinin n=1 Tax=Fischerella thermalis JSC-11 TaxID=741277 RepID=G6G0H5_9CYAN|nr:hypothetical protein FJSC11DRAFT_4624 [Fischerella thermalis JSC-11]